MTFPEVESLRPTPDRVRETVFNWLAPYLAGARVLDLFAGSGILGLESLSRGASSVVAVENNPAVAEHLREWGRQLETNGLEVVTMDVMRFLGTTRLRPFHIVFIDPPHASTDYDALCEALEAGGLAVPGALVYLEVSTPRAADGSAPYGWSRHRSSRAGHLTYELWRRAGAPD